MLLPGASHGTHGIKLSMLMCLRNAFFAIAPWTQLRIVIVGFRCYVQWTEHWDSNGMEAVAVAKLQTLIDDTGNDAPDMSRLAQQVQVVHNSRLAAGATPRHYLAFVSLCGRLYSKKRSQLLEQQDFLKVTTLCPHCQIENQFVSLFPVYNNNAQVRHGLCCVQSCCFLIASSAGMLLSCHTCSCLVALFGCICCSGRPGQAGWSCSHSRHPLQRGSTAARAAESQSGITAGS